jgi:hypothetical protein
MRHLALPAAAFFIVGGIIAIVALLPPICLFPWLLLSLKLLHAADRFSDDEPASP